MSLIIAFFEMFALLLFYFSGGIHAPSCFRSTLQVLFCVITCFITYGLTCYLQEKDERDISDKARYLLVLFYIIMTVWATFVDYFHYVDGTQMITFYIVQFSFVVFIIFTPYISGFLFIGGFSFFYIILLAADGAAKMQIQNYLVFLLVALTGSYARFLSIYREKKSAATVRKMNKALEGTVQIDDLTKLKNRYALRNDFPRYCDHHLFVMMIDVDYFKHYNDFYGHLVGDQVLQKISESLMNHFSEESIYRYGGDEILIVVKANDGEQFDKCVQKWKKSLPDIHVDEVNETIRCSCGIVEGEPHDETELRALIQRADDRLYQEKRSHHAKKQ